jgi:thiol-disulfide isomerase/thioredoxin
MKLSVQHRTWLVIGVLVVALHATAQSAPAPSPAQPAASPAETFQTDPKFIDTLKEAKKLEHQKHAAFAADAYKKANKIAAGRCPECLEGLFATQMMQGNYKDAIAASQALSALATDHLTRSVAATDRGRALLAQAGDKPRPAQLEASHAAFQEAVAAFPKNVAALYQDGQVLALMGKMTEASADFKQCLSCIRPDDPAHLRAEHFAENPELATHKMAPAFDVIALDGSRFNLDAMGGRVVLIDFWATWCGPCNRELPHMKKIAKEFANQPLVIISVSWDQDEGKWKDFIAKNEMTWVQYRDANHELSNEFGINAIPHYFTIDSDGVLTAEMLGEDSDVEGKLKKLLAKARKAREAMPAVSSAGN